MSNYNPEYESEYESEYKTESESEYKSEYESEYETDNESYGSWDETDIDYITYEHQEISLSKYNLVLCELYDRNIHGNIDGEINYHYLTFTRFKIIDNNFINNNFVHLMSSFPNRINLEISQCLYLPSQHCVSILKTYWLKLIQRTWKKICRNRKITVLRRSNPNAIKYREIYGKWPNNCIDYPSLIGMLSNLSRASSRISS